MDCTGALACGAGCRASVSSVEFWAKMVLNTTHSQKTQRIKKNMLVSLTTAKIRGRCCEINSTA